MGLETVIEDVLAQGRSEAEEIHRATLAERERILREAREEGAKLLAQREQEGRQAAERLRIQALARAELESKKIVLSAQQELLDQVYSSVLEKFPRLPEIESGNYPYVTARVRAKKAALLSEDTYERMLQMEIPQIARILSEGAYKAEILALATKASGVDLIELATSRNLAAVYTQIIEFSEGELRQMIGWYLDRFDVQNVKTIIRG